MKLNKLLLLLMLLVVAVPLVSAAPVGFSDSFGSYGSNYFILSDSNVSKVTSFDQDTNQPTSKNTQSNGYSLNWLDRNSMYVPVDVSLNAADASRVIIRADCNCDIPDYNENGVLHMPFWIDANTSGSGISVYIRIGQSTGNYFEYRKTFAEETSWWIGRHDLTYDLNAADAITGSPSFNDVNFLWVIVNHGAAQVTDYNWSINGIWVEKAGGFSGGNWDIVSPNINPQGMAIINPANQLVLNNIDRQSYGYHGRIFATAFDGIDLTERYLSLQADTNIVDANWGSRLMWDYVDGHNFTACFIFYSTPTSLRYGIEQWIDNVRDFNQVTAVSAYGVSKEVRCETDTVTGTNVTMYVDDVVVATMTVAQRFDGRIGFEQFSNGAQQNGKVRYDNVSFTATEFGSIVQQQGTCGTEQNRFDFSLIPFVVALIMLFAAIDGWKKGNLQQMAVAVGMGVLCIVVISLICM